MEKITKELKDYIQREIANKGNQRLEELAKQKTKELAKEIDEAKRLKDEADQAEQKLRDKLPRDKLLLDLNKGKIIAKSADYWSCENETREVIIKLQYEDKKIADLPAIINEVIGRR